ncbi:MAG: type II toxin-antitoxin system Phd/YefM family antitoxin [Zoogloeaceae bacterium]|nr:type II toxin-antitoxin system Phd/YefM family antitoxin [Zoogloeaceae bacterium]MCK6383830.1 type II toxin-antitoxin system Phd/YefM family antitoxin [Rhodocyclaceae bacterium]
MTVVNIHDAKTRLSKLLEQVQSGEDVVIAKAGTPIARLIPYAQAKRRIAPPGGMAGEIWIADDFDAPIDDLFDCLKQEAE